MSSAASSKSKDKKSGKEMQKALPKTLGAVTGNGVPGSAYNPLSGTFHTLEAAPASVHSPIQSNVRFKDIDETDEHSGTSVTAGVDYDSVSNNGSWSGESEDHKEKGLNSLPQLEPIPGADIDKREKIRLKNERKHQRQKERRAQELHERCCGYLMSRKLETLAQQLVAMGFAHERATMALISNEGRVEDSVAWLIERGEDADNHKDKSISGSNLKIDISEELAWIAAMQIRFNCSKQEVERTVVACEGDLEKAAENLRTQKKEPVSAPRKLQESGDPWTASSGNLSAGTTQDTMRPQPKASSTVLHQRKEENDVNYAKAAVIGGPVESGSKNPQPLRVQSELEWPKPEQAAMSAEKRWPNVGSNSSVSYSLQSPLQVSAPQSGVKTETSNVTSGGESRNTQPGPVREPLVIMQRPHPLNSKQIHATSMSTPDSATAVTRHPATSVEVVKPPVLPDIPSTRSLGPNNVSSGQLFHPLNYRQQCIPGSSLAETVGTSRWSRAGASPTLAPATSLGLFSRLGSSSSSGMSAPLDWTNGSSVIHLDYMNVDWSLDRKPNIWLELEAATNNGERYDSSVPRLVPNPTMRPAPTYGNVTPFVGLQDGGGAGEISAVGSREWTSPFEANDLFSLPRQFVSSPSL